MSGGSDAGRLSLVVWQFLLGAVFLLAWEWASRSGALDPFFFSRPSDVAARVWTWAATGSIWPHLLTTSIEAMLSFGIGALLGIAAGFSLARASFLAALLEPYIRVG